MAFLKLTELNNYDSNKTISEGLFLFKALLILLTNYKNK